LLFVRFQVANRGKTKNKAKTKTNYYINWYCNRRMPTSSHSNLTKPHYTSSWSPKDKKQQNNTPLQHVVMPEYTLQEPTTNTNIIPAIQTSSSQGSASLAYSIDTDAMNSNTSSKNNVQQQPNIQPTASKDNSEANEYSIYSSGEMSAEQYYQAAALSNHSQYSTLDEQQQEQQQLLGVVNEGQEYDDATPTVHNMHRKLLHLLSSPNLFSDAIEWQMKVDRGLDPSLPDDNANTNNNVDEDGMKSFDNEFNEDNISRAVSEQKDDTDDGQTATTNGDEDTTNQNKYKDQSKLIPPLPIQIFASDAEVVLPQALTASQLFGIERVSGIELEAAAGIIGLSQLFTRWLALMPEGDHLNIIDPPGLTVMKISGGRYRVTGAHRVIWRWMNCFSPASMFTIPSDKVVSSSGEEGDTEKKDTDFDFGDLVTMTIIDVFETDSDGKLLSYCPTFDNRAVHKTPETIERIRKGYQMTKERIDVVANSPAGRSVNKVSNVVVCLCFVICDVSICVAYDIS